MSNTNAPRGAWPVRHLAGGIIRASEHLIASGFGTNILTGDFVKLVTGGGIEDADAGDRLLGVFWGVQYVDAQGDQQFRRYWPASLTATEIKAVVFDDPNIVFGIQSNGSSVAADVGNLANHVASSGNVSTGQSAHEINGTTSTAEAGLRVLGKVAAPDNAWGTNVDLEVMIYMHEFSRIEPSTPGV